MADKNPEVIAVASSSGEVIHPTASDVQQIAAKQIEVLKDYCQTWNDPKLSFRWALVAAGVGLLFLVGAIVAAVASSSAFPAVLATIGAAVSELIAAINFWFCRKAARQVSHCRERLHQLQRYLLADTICEKMEGETKAYARYNLVAAIANFPSGPRIFGRNERESQTETHGRRAS